MIKTHYFILTILFASL